MTGARAEVAIKKETIEKLSKLVSHIVEEIVDHPEDVRLP